VKDVTLPLPVSGAGSHARRWHAGQNSFGGTARVPQEAQRMAVSRPARASSKKLCSVITRSITAEQADENGGGVPTECVNEPRPRALYLPRSRGAAQLSDDFGDLRRAGRADGMPLRLETAGRIDGDLAAQAGHAFFRRAGTAAGLEESETFRGHDLGDGEAVVELYH